MLNKLNLASGSIFVSDNGWLNFDYGGDGKLVRRANLLSRMPLPDNSADLVYSSHFLEHIPYSLVPDFLVECRRLLCPNGVIRVVLPDLENMCQAYLDYRNASSHEKADFIVLELIDQCVRRAQGGELGRYYEAIMEQPGLSQSMIDFVRERTGEDLFSSPSRRRRSWRSILSRLLRLNDNARIHFATLLLPKAFRDQNISFCSVGEKHHWIYDEFMISRLLMQAGFQSIQRMSASSSLYPNFPFHPLDVDTDGKPRKGAESMYIEAVKSERLKP